MNKPLDKNTLVDLIATELPDQVIDKINKENLEQTQDLFDELRTLEHLIKGTIPGKWKIVHQNFKVTREKLLMVTKIGCQDSNKNKIFNSCCNRSEKFSI